jgi:uncharacterized protein YqeY
VKPTQDASVFRDRLRRDLRAALKSRQPETISTLRTMIAAIDNAEAIHPEAESPRCADGIIAHSSAGIGSTEAPRRELGMADIQAIVRGLIFEYETHGERYRAMRQHEAAERLQRKANILHTYLSMHDSGFTGCDHGRRVSSGI